MENFNAKTPLRIGISMRIANAEDYHEPRDALAHDWYNFLNESLPDTLWLPIPNLGEKTSEFLSAWGLNAFILTGGNDLASEPLRDSSENIIINYAIKNKLPLLAVCRGLQLMVHRFNGKISEAANRKHLASTHAVRVTSNPVGYKKAEAMTVNSYHNYLVNDPGELIPFAFDAEGNIEGVYLQNAPCAAIMWHPERMNPAQIDDTAFIKHFFGIKK